MVRGIRLLLAVVALVGALVIFIGSLVIMMSDGQGAMVFIVSVPAIAILLVTGNLVLRTVDESPARTKLARLIKTMGIGVTAYFVLMPIPVVNWIPNILNIGVGKAFELIVGKSPYAWARARNDVMAMLEAELARTGGHEIDLSRIKPARDFSRVCVLGPRTQPAAAKPFLNIRYDWAMESYTEVWQSDTICALVFMDDDRSPAHVVNFPRARADFAQYSMTCIGRNDKVKVP